MTPSGPFWSLLTILGPILLIVAIAWSMYKNRKEPRNEIDKTDRATHDLYKAQDEQDKRARDKQDDAAN